jgi:hypothetical protein
VLLTLVEHDAAAAAAAAASADSFEASQERVFVGRVVSGDAQKLVEYPKAIARGDECIIQVLTRMVTLQRDEVEDQRLQGPVVVGGVRMECAVIPRKALVLGDARQSSVVEILAAVVRSWSAMRSASLW